MPNPVVHFEISGKDGAKLQEFYAKLFDWNISTDNPMHYGMVEKGGDGGIGGGIQTASEGVPYLTFYVQVDDLQAYLDKATELGGQMVLPPTDIPGVGQYAFIKDIDGNMLGLFKG
jgi:predicted enzyme related to lactoylglutathione lyase